VSVKCPNIFIEIKKDGNKIKLQIMDVNLSMYVQIVSKILETDL